MTIEHDPPRACRALTAKGLPCRARVRGQNVFCPTHGGTYVATPLVHRCGVRGKRGWACALKVSRPGECCWLHRRLAKEAERRPSCPI